MRQIVGLLGTPIDKLSIAEVLDRLDQFIQERRFHQVATANTDFLINAISDPELRHILREADLVVPDGMPVVWASRLMGSPLPERVAGADIVPRLAALAARKGYTIYMLGARPEVALRAKARLEADYPGVQIVGCVSPPTASIVELDWEDVLADIARTEPDILLVAFGNPKQEKWIHMHRDRLQMVPVCMGVGGTFDFIAGEVPRAPSFVQRFGFEWVHRLLQDPKRLWRRYARDFSQGGNQLIKQWWGMRQQRKTGAFDIHVAQAGECAILSPMGDLDRSALPRFCAAADEALNAGARLILDFQGVACFDTEVLGTLLNLPKRAAYCLQEVRLVAVPPNTARVLRASHLDSELYPISESVAHAVTDWEHDGLYWRVQCGNDAAVVTVNGAANVQTTCQLEKVCTRLMNISKRVDIDVRGVTYVDSHLLAALYRLAQQSDNPIAADMPVKGLRLVAGGLLRKALEREKMLDRFNILAFPEVPHDASEMASFALEMHSIHRSGLSTEAAHTERRPALAVITSS